MFRAAPNMARANAPASFPLQTRYACKLQDWQQHAPGMLLRISTST